MSPKELDIHVPNLFQAIEFTTHAKLKSNWKIECDALCDDDWITLARLGSCMVESFGRAYGIPNGGLKFAEALNEFSDKSSSQIIIVDDVCTTGTSLIEFSKQFEYQPLAVVAFNRGSFSPWWLCSIFQCNVHENFI